MKIAGLLLLIAGCVVVVAGLKMDTTVEVRTGDSYIISPRVHNLNLAARQDHTVTIGCFAALAGIILIGLAECVVPPRDLVARHLTQSGYQPKASAPSPFKPPRGDTGVRPPLYPPPKTNPPEAPPPPPSPGRRPS